MSSVPTVKLVSCNIEGQKHFSRFIPFLKTQQPDVVCLQEVFEVDLPMLAATLDMEAHFVPMLNSPQSNSFNIEASGLLGLAILTKLPIDGAHERYYVGQRHPVPLLDESNNNCLNRAVQWLDVVKQQQVFRIATTHFTWAPGGGYLPLQGENLAVMEDILKEQLSEFVLCGDFNSPRGGVVYQRLVEWLQDNIPAEVTTSIDGQWHKAGQLELMVDYLFSTSRYIVANVGVQSGVSDHMAVVGHIQKR